MQDEPNHQGRSVSGVQERGLGKEFIVVIIDDIII